MRRRLIGSLAILAVLLSGCVSRSFTEIDSVAVVDGRFYAREIENVEAATELRFWVLGTGWQRVEAPSEIVIAALDTPPSTHECDTGGCYSLREDRLRIAGPSGETVWGMSAGRNEWIARYRQADPVDGMRLEDIAVNGGTVLAAAGIEGVVIGTGDDWERLGVGAAVPTPTSAFGSAIDLEILAVIAAGVAIAWLWMMARMNGADPDGFYEVTGPGTTWLLVLSVPALGLGYLLVVAGGFGSERLHSPSWLLPVFAFGAVAALAIGSVMRRAERRGGPMAIAAAGTVVRFWTLAIVVGVAASTPLFGWTLGTPDRYGVAVLSAVGIGAGAAAVLLWRAPRMPGSTRDDGSASAPVDSPAERADRSVNPMKYDPEHY